MTLIEFATSVWSPQGLFGFGLGLIAGVVCWAIWGS